MRLNYQQKLLICHIINKQQPPTHFDYLITRILSFRINMNLYRLPLLILALLLLAHTTLALPKFWPLPQKLTINTKATPLQISPCDVRYLITSPISVLMQTVNHYLQNVFKCTSQGQSNITLNINVAGSSINLPLETSQEAYSLFIRQNGRWQLTAEQYSGFLRGLQTYSQIFQQDQNNKFFVEGIPIGIDDKPEYKWRGILIDSSRHFLPIASIKKQIDAMLYNKMNVLHWHIIDQDSFPYEVESVPELSQYGKLSGTYSKNEISQLISYAILRGVRIVVELDSPAHTDAWGRSEKYKDIVVKCDNKYEGQFDPTIDLTYDVVRSVFNEANQLFDDPYIHFGGDEVDLNCWNKKPSIKQWMNNNNISTYKQLQILYRKKQKTLYRTISSTKKVIYWANEEIDLPVQDDDVIQWWGQTKNLKNLVNRPNEVILSNYDETYLDVGFGSRNGGNYLTYIKWRDIYKFEPKFTGVNIIGGEVCMWGELSNQRTNQQKIWNRASILAQRLWNSRIVLATNLNDIATRLVAHSRRLNKRGIKTSPVTVQICEQNMSICF